MLGYVIEQPLAKFQCEKKLWPQEEAELTFTALLEKACVLFSLFKNNHPSLFLGII